MCTTTAAAREFSSRSSASTRSLSLRIRPSIWTRAIAREVVNVLRPLGVAIRDKTMRVRDSPGFRFAPSGLRFSGTQGTNKKAPVETGARLIADQKARGLLVGALLERGAENIAQRRPRIGGAVLRDGFLLFGDFQ